MVNWLLLAATVILFFKVAVYKDPVRHVITNDVLEYYAYLPRTFIDRDPTFAQWDRKFNVNVWIHPTEGGTGLSLKMTMGLSLLYMPFFLVAHALAPLLGFPADGYSEPYELALFFSMFFYLALGLHFLRRVLERYFSQLAVCTTLILIMAATNMAWYLIWQPCMGHVYSFSLSAIFLWQVLRYRDDPGGGRILLIGFLLGIITLVRPTNLLLGLFLPVFGVHSWQGLRSSLGEWLARSRHILLMVGAMALVWLPQWLFWKATSGDWFYYSYRDEHFLFADPHLFVGLFGYRNGWLLYTPVMLLAFAGLWVLYRRFREWFWPVTLFVVIFTYVALSWWCWWYIGYGNRAFIDAYAVLAIPLAAFLHRGFERRWRGALTGLLVGLFLFHGIFQTLQSKAGMIHTSAMSKEAYWLHFMKLEMDPEYWNVLEYPDASKAKLGIDALRDK